MPIGIVMVVSLRRQAEARGCVALPQTYHEASARRFIDRNIGQPPLCLLGFLFCGARDGGTRDGGHNRCFLSTARQGWRCQSDHTLVISETIISHSCTSIIQR